PPRARCHSSHSSLPRRTAPACPRRRAGGRGRCSGVAAWCLSHRESFGDPSTYCPFCPFWTSWIQGHSDPSRTDIPERASMDLLSSAHTLVIPVPPHEWTPPVHGLQLDGIHFGPKPELHITVVTGRLGGELHRSLGPGFLDGPVRRAFGSLDWT